jgi:hypothetical protein
MKKQVLFVMLIASITLSYKSYRFSDNATLWLMDETIESLTKDGEFPDNLECGSENGICWAGEEKYFFGIIKYWTCPHFTGDKYTYCKSTQKEVSTSYDEWVASQN